MAIHHCTTFVTDFETLCPHVPRARWLFLWIAPIADPPAFVFEAPRATMAQNGRKIPISFAAHGSKFPKPGHSIFGSGGRIFWSRRNTAQPGATTKKSAWKQETYDPINKRVMKTTCAEATEVLRGGLAA